MKRKFLVFLLLFLLVFTLSSYSQSRFSGENAREYVRKLSSPEFKGRQSGLEGGEKAAEWIAMKFEEFGLKPGGDNGTFFQEFPLLVTEEKPPVKFELINDRRGRVKYFLEYDFDLFTNSGSGKVEAEIVFAGLGICEPEKGRDDYAGIDVKGKIVMVYRANPADGKDWSREYSRDYKVRVAHEKGAVGFLLVQGERAIKGGAIHENAYFEDMPGFWVSRKVGRDIFKYTGINFDNTLRDLPKKVISFNTGKIALMETNVERKIPGRSRNVIGIIPGTDPELKDEYIVIGGHMDHVGIDGDGNIYPGADDNASGTSVVMELARAIIAGKKEHKRSLIFSAFAAEEQGLLGSTYFVNHPPVSEDKIVAMFNFDMVGEGNQGIGISGMENFPLIWDKLYQSLPENRRKKIRLSRARGSGSDHYPFMQKLIPAIGHFSIGDHPFYHGVEDKVDLISANVLENIGNQSMEFILAIANREKPLADGRINQRFIYYSSNQADLSFSRSISPCNPENSFSELKNLKLKGVKIKTVQVSGKNIEVVLNNIDSWYAFENKYREYFRIGKNKTEIRNIINSQRMVLIPGIKGTKSLNKNPAFLRNLGRLGVKYINISPEDYDLFIAGGLSSWGEKFLSTCRKEGIYVCMNIHKDLPYEEILKAGSSHIILNGCINCFMNTPEKRIKLASNYRAKLVLDVFKGRNDPDKIAIFIKKCNYEGLKLNLSRLAVENTDEVFDFIYNLQKNGITEEMLINLLNIEF